MKKNLKKMAAVSLAAASICTCLSGCRNKAEDETTSNPVPTPSITASDSASGNPEVSGNVDTSGGVKLENGQIVLTPITAESPITVLRTGIWNTSIWMALIGIRNTSPP